MIHIYRHFHIMMTEFVRDAVVADNTANIVGSPAESFVIPMLAFDDHPVLNAAYRRLRRFGWGGDNHRVAATPESLEAFYEVLWLGVAARREAQPSRLTVRSILEGSVLA